MDKLPSIGLDLKLGLRMLLKYPVLTLVGGIAITVATALGVGFSEFIHDLVAADVPLDEGDRIVRLYHDDTQGGGTTPTSLYDLQVWRETVSSLEDVGASTTLEQGIVGDRGEVGSVDLARISASAFRLTRVPPLMGRFLLDADEVPGAPAVVVLGYEAWQRLFGADPDVVGRTVRLGGETATIVGVMPEGYAFPGTQNAWAPLRVDPADIQPETAPRMAMFARLAPGASIESAQSELDVAGERAAAELPAIYGSLRPRVFEFARGGSAVQLSLLLSAVRLLLALVAAVICANVATLVFARTVMREGEIALRTSLGASRRRVVLQLVGETLVLVVGAALLGLSIAAFALPRIGRLFFTIQQAPQPPFWWNDALSLPTIAYALVLAAVGALMIGVVPALRATKGALRTRLGQPSAGGGGGLKLGGVWTVVIVLEVAIAVAFLPVAVAQGGTVFASPVRTTFPADEYVTARLGRDAPTPTQTEEERTALFESSWQLFQEVRDRIATDPAVEGAALVSGLSAMNHIQVPLEVDGGASGPALSSFARILLVDPSYLDLMGADVIAGRALDPADFTRESRSVVVNEAFADVAFEGRNAVGTRLRFTDRIEEQAIVTVPAVGESVEIVGVVRNPEIDVYGPGAHPVVYAPLELAAVSPRDVGFVGMPQPPATQLFIRLRPGTEPLAGRIYGIVAAVDPSLRLSQVATAAGAWGPVHQGARIGAWIALAVGAIVLMLSVAGVYALMSFTVSRRTREIAIRTAVGAGRGQIVRAVFQRALIQLLIGVALGSLIAVPVLWDGLEDDGFRTLAIVSSVLLVAGLGACVLPVRRALAIEPSLAMKSE